MYSTTLGTNAMREATEAERRTHSYFLKGGFSSYSEMDAYDDYVNLTYDGETEPMTLEEWRIYR